jgi:hypothetical protein
MASAAFRFAAQAVGAEYAIAAAGTVTASLESTVGVRTTQWDMMSTDETAPSWTVGTPTATSSLITAPAAVSGVAGILRCRVNGGDGATDGSTYTAKIYVAPKVICVGETLEADSTYGWCAVINPVLRLFASSSTNPTIVAPSGGYCAVFEAATEVVRISDDGNISLLQGRGSSGTRLETNAGSLTLRCAATGVIQLQESTTDVAYVFDAANVSTIQGRGSSGTQVAANSAYLQLRCASGSEVRIQEDTSDVLYLSDAAGVSTLSGRGASGTTLVANASNLVLDCASGSVVRVSEGGTNVAEFWDNGGQRKLVFGGAAVISGSSYIVFQPGGAQHFGVEATSIYMSADSQYFRSTSTATTYGTCLSGVWTLGTSGGSAVHAINGSTASTVGAAGAATAVPAQPDGYLRVSINGATKKIPYFADA